MPTAIRFNLVVWPYCKILLFAVLADASFQLIKESSYPSRLCNSKRYRSMFTTFGRPTHFSPNTRYVEWVSVFLSQNQHRKFSWGSTELRRSLKFSIEMAGQKDNLTAVLYGIDDLRLVRFRPSFVIYLTCCVLFSWGFAFFDCFSVFAASYSWLSFVFNLFCHTCFVSIMS